MRENIDLRDLMKFIGGSLAVICFAGIASAGPKEEAVIVACTESTSGEPYATGACAATALGLEEARKCIESGGSDCVGESNTARKVIENPKEALEDLGDSVGKKTERALKDLRKIKLPKIERPPRIKVPKVKLPKL